MHISLPARALPFIVAGLVLLPSFPAFAQTGQAPSTALDALADCQRIATDGARLACYDATAARIAGARRSGDLLTLDRGEVVERKRRRFGLADAAQNPLGGGEADRLTKVTELQTTVAAVRPASYARFLLQLANNTVWETIEPLKLAPAIGTPVTIKQAGFGGFKAVIGSERPILVKRQR